MEAYKHALEGEQTDTACAAILSHMPDLFSRTGVRPSETGRLDLRVGDNGLFSITFRFKDGSKGVWEGRQAGDRILDLKDEKERAGASSFRHEYQFRVIGAGERSGDGRASAVADRLATIEPGSGKYVRIARTESLPVEVEYAAGAPHTLAGGVNGTGQVRLEETAGTALNGEGPSVPVPEVERVEPAGADAPDRMAKQGEGGISWGIGDGAVLMQNRIVLSPANKPPGYDQVGERIEAVFEPTIAYVFTYQKEPVVISKVLVAYDSSQTVAGKEADIDRKINEVARWLQASAGGSVEEVGHIGDGGQAEHCISPMPEDLDLQNENIVLSHEKEFVHYFGNKITGHDAAGTPMKIKGGEKTVRDIVDSLYRGRRVDYDNHWEAIFTFMKSYYDKKNRHTDLVLIGDGGNLYRRWEFDPQAYAEWKKDPENYRGKEPWRFEFDRKGYALGLQWVREFHRHFPQARIHFVHDPFTPGALQIFTPPTDHEQISTMARATGGKVITYSEDFSLDVQRRDGARENYALVPAVEMAWLKASPIRRPIFSMEAGSRLITTPNKEFFKIGPSLTPKRRYEVDLKQHLMVNPNLKPPFDPYLRFPQTMPYLDALFEFAGMHELRGRARPLSYALDQWAGLAGAMALGNQAAKSAAGMKTDAAYRHVLDLFDANSQAILFRNWNGKPPSQFPELGPTGKSLDSFSLNLMRTEYLDAALGKLDPNSELYGALEKERDRTAALNLPLTANVVAQSPWGVMVYYGGLSKILHSITHAEGAGPAYFKFFYDAGESGTKNEGLKGKDRGPPAPLLKVGIVAVRDPIVPIPNNENLTVQIQGVTGVFLNTIFNTAMFDFLQSTRHTLDFGLDFGIGGLLADKPGSAWLKFGTVDLRDRSTSERTQGYLAKWRLSDALAMASMRMRLAGSWTVYENGTSLAKLNYSATLHNVPLDWVLGAGFGGGMKKEFYSIAPQLEKSAYLPPIGIRVNPVFNMMWGAEKAMLEGAAEAMPTADGRCPLVLNEVSFSGTIAPFGGKTPLTLRIAREGFAGPSTVSAGAKASRELFDGFVASVKGGADFIENKAFGTVQLDFKYTVSDIFK